MLSPHNCIIFHIFPQIKKVVEELEDRPELQHVVSISLLCPFNSAADRAPVHCVGVPMQRTFLSEHCSHWSFDHRQCAGITRM